MQRRDLIIGLGLTAIVPVPAIAEPVKLDFVADPDRMARYRQIDKLDSIPRITRRLDQIVDWSSPRNMRGLLKYGDWFYYRDVYSIHPSLVRSAIVDEKKHEVIAWVVDLATRMIIPAKLMVHMSQQHEVFASRWPFGMSVLESDFLVTRTGFEPVLSV